ncbi:46028_t:CDS:2, partial [Gigaspora margarita]
MRSSCKLVVPLLLILFIKCIICYNPGGRRELQSALISNKLYFYGGWDYSSGGLGDIFYIDLSQPFDSSNPTFQLQSMQAPKAAYSSVVYEDEIIIFAGSGDKIGMVNDLVIINETDFFVNTTTTKNSSNSNINGWPAPRRWHPAVIDSIKAKIDAAIYKFDLITYSWNVNTLPNQPVSRRQHTATLIPDGKIIFIGGMNTPDIAQLDIYDTIANQWSQKIAIKSGNVSARYGHTATLTPNNRSIIVYGGLSYNLNQSIGGIAILDLTTYIWTNSTPSGDQPASPNLHTAAIYKNYIIFAFGAFGIGSNNNYSSAVNILDISNDQYKSVNLVLLDTPSKQNPDATSPNNTKTGTSPNSKNTGTPPNNLNTRIVVGLIIVCVFSVGFLAIIGYLIYSRNRDKNDFESLESKESGNE